MAVCLACRLSLQIGDKVLLDVSGDWIHAACCGPERESYVNAAGEPLKEGEAIPEPFTWGADV